MRSQNSACPATLLEMNDGKHGAGNVERVQDELAKLKALGLC